MKHEAFTLIELLIVIGIITVLSTVVFLDFRGVRESQVLKSSVQELDALMQQNRAEVRAGKSSEEWEWLCEGVALAVGQAPQKLEGRVGESGHCEESDRMNYGMTEEAVTVQQILVGEEALGSELDLWFLPPEGQVEMWQGNAALQGNLEVTLAATASPEKTLSYSFDPTL